MQLLPVVVALCLAAHTDVSGSSDLASDSAKVHRLFDDFWEEIVSQDPAYATSLGDHRFDDKLSDVSEGAWQRHYNSLRAIQKRAAQIDPGHLPAADAINLKLLTNRVDRELAGERFRAYLMPLTHTDGIHLSLMQLPGIHPFKTVVDYENYLCRLEAFSVQVDKTLQNMRKGITEGVTLPEVIVHKIDRQLSDGLKKNRLGEPAERMPKDFSESDRLRLTKEIDDRIRTSVIPAYRRLADFVRTEYLPKARRDVGLWSLADGEARFDYEIKYHTTTGFSATELYEVGVQELERLESEQRQIIARVGFKGTVGEFHHLLRTGKQFRLTNRRSVETRYREILGAIEPKLSRLFSQLPAMNYKLKPLDSIQADTGLQGYYEPAALDGSTPPIFYYNAYQIERAGYATYSMEQLAYHEIVPGHHLQLSLARAHRDWPTFRTHAWYGAFGEGWAEYAKQLAAELGGFHEPYSEYGRLVNDPVLLLLVSVGIHHQHWTRDAAIEFLQQHSVLDESQINNLVDDCIASIPGYALAYKVGQMRFAELRMRAERELGEKFDIRAFHAVELGEGALPLDLLSKRVEAWIARSRHRATSPH